MTPEHEPSDDRGSLLRFTPLAPPRTRLTFAFDHPYLDLVYMPLIGPGAVALLRRVCCALTDSTTSVEIDAAALARDLGLRSSRTDPIGERSPLMRTLVRLNRQRLTTRMGQHHIGVYQPVPALDQRDLDRLPDTARAAHDRYTAPPPA
ncbi:MAG TPA: hypothetical protein VNQ73_09385 [Ilumatobacter sp.]|nr:hypothetical protein [Ilumatobacter sp.]